MSLPSYIINWDEIVPLLENALQEVVIKTMKDVPGTQKIKGSAVSIPALQGNFSVFEWKVDRKIVLTGLTYSQSAWKGEDYWELWVDGDRLFETVYTKELGEQKHWEVIYPVEPMQTIKVVLSNVSGNSRDVWTDLEYLELDIGARLRPREDGENPDDPKPEEPKPEEPKPVNDKHKYFCDDSINANDINTQFWKWSNLSKEVARNQFNKTLTGEFWTDRNSLLSIMEDLVGDEMTKNSVNTSDFHKFLFKAWSESDSVRINTDWKTFKDWADINLPCLNDLQKGTLFYTVKSRIKSLIFSANSDFLQGKIPDVVTSYLGKLPNKVVDWIDYNDIVQDSGSTITGAFAIDITSAGYPELFNEFTSCINIEPQSLNFSESGLIGHNPSDYVNSQGDFWGARVPSSIVDWTNYIPAAFSSGDAETRRGIVAVETVIHEYAHSVDYYYKGVTGQDLSSRKQWLDIGGWTITNGKYNYLVKDKHSNQTSGLPRTNANKEAPVSDYGCSQPAEDFAEAFVVYITNPNFLRSKYPQRYAFMEEYVKPLI